MSPELTSTGNSNPLQELSSKRNANIASDVATAYIELPRTSKIDASEPRPLPQAVQFAERAQKSSSLHHRDSNIVVSNDLFHLRTLSPQDDRTSFGNVETSDANSSGVAPSGMSSVAPISKQQKRKSIIHFVTLCYCVWLMGWNDGTLGPLLPGIQNNYRLGYSTVSMIFVGNCAGYVTGSALNIWLSDHYTFGKIIVGSALFQLAGYLILITSPPFALIICAYTLLGFGISIQSAQANGLVGSLHQHVALKLGLMHGAYGMGAFISPFAATYFSTITGRKWAFHFILSAGFSVLNTLFLTYVFRFRRHEDVLLEAGQEPHVDLTNTNRQRGGSTYKQILKLREVHLLTAFALIYIGVEVTLGGWIPTFIIRERHGGPKAGYISSGFFGGFTAGRVGLIWINEKIGIRRAIYIYSVIAIGLELSIWFVPSIIGNAVAATLIGVALGPMFPMLVSHMTNILPRWLLTGSVGIVVGTGFAGSAALPFITGLLASKYGIGSLQPLLVSMMGCMVCVWALVPKTTRVD